MKLLIVRGYGSIMNIGNYNTQEIGLAKAFINKGIDADIVFYGGNEETYIQRWSVANGKNINIYWLKGRQYLKHGVMPEVYELAEKYDILWLDEFNQYTSFELIKRYSDKVCVYHGPYEQNYNLPRKILNGLTSRLFFREKFAESVQVFSKSKLAEEYLKKVGFKNVETIGVGLDSSRFCNYEDLDLSEFGISEDERYLLYVGTIDERRNVLFLLEILKKLHEKGSDCKLVLVGKAKKQYWSKCKKVVEESDLQNNVIYIECLNQNQLPMLYKNAEVFLFPTRYDIFGMVLMEAMIFETPVISSYNGGSSTLITDKENGFICSDSVDEWVKTTEKILNNSDLAEHMGKLARHTILESFNWDAIVCRILPIIEDVVDEKRTKC